MNQKVALFVVVATAIVAIAGFLLVSFLLRPTGDTGNGALADNDAQSGADSREGWVTEQRVVGDVPVNVAYDPAKQVAIISTQPELPEPPAPEVTETPAVATETPTGGDSLEGNGSSGTTDGTAGATPAGSSGTPGGDTSGAAPSSPGVGGAPDVIFVPYQVGPADTLFGVAQHHINRGQITSVALMARYGIDSTSLVAGSTINVPVANPAYCPGLRPYVVLEGDNAFRIAQRAGISVQTLAQINSLDAQYTVYVTQVICLP